MSNQHLSLAFSPCPNDTFIMDALIHSKIHSNFTFDVKLDDVECLNNYAKDNAYSVTKMSFGAYPSVSKNYQILSSGSALGRGCGPLLIVKKDFKVDELANLKVGIPGLKTTANLLLSILFPHIKNKVILLFSDIETALLNNEIDVGLIIHESRFTFQDKGLKLIADLGALWEEQTGFPIPLGCFVVQRDLPLSIKLNIQDEISNSIKFAFQNPSSSSGYVNKHAQEMNIKVQQQHIQLYVNDFSINLGEEGKEAIQFLFNQGIRNKLFDTPQLPIFIDN